MQTLLSTPFKAVLFDMDNTLYDFVEAMKKGCVAAAASVGEGTGDELLGYYLRWKYHFEDHTNLQDYMMAHNRFSVEKYFEAVGVFDEAKMNSLELYPGIEEVLAGLKSAGYRLAIVTDAFSYAAESRLSHLGLRSYFDVIVGYDTTGYKKPHHAPFECALDLLGLSAHEAAYVGDSIRRDIEPVKALGMTAVYAKYGDRNFFDHPSLPCPPKVLVADTPLAILRLLQP
jgi:putative hydrolase of the HAD superfamily